MRASEFLPIYAACQQTERSEASTEGVKSLRAIRNFLIIDNIYK